MCVTFVTCEVRMCGPRCHSGSSLYIYHMYLLTYPPSLQASQCTFNELSTAEHLPVFPCFLHAVRRPASLGHVSGAGKF